MTILPSQKTDLVCTGSFVRKIPFPLLLIKERVIVDISEYGLKSFGFNIREQICGKKIFQVSPIYQPDGKKSEDIYNDALNQAELGHEVTKRVQLSHSDGTLFSAELIFSPDTDLQSQIIIVGIYNISTPETSNVHDIKSKHEFDSIFYNNPALMLIIDPSHQIIDVNQAWIDASGYSKQQLLSMKVMISNAHRVQVVLLMMLSERRKQTTEN
jgi:PAS domain-containing protein